MNCFFMLLICIANVLLSTVQLDAKSEDYAFYFKVDSGVSSAQPADIIAVYPPWDTAIQGYDAPLKSCAITGLSIGCEFFHILDLEVNASNRSFFEYKKYQTSMINNQNYTREFDLSVTPILFTANILGRGIPHLHADLGAGKLYPLLGGGIGMSNLLITNYRTTGLPATGDSVPYQSFSAENQYTLRKNFTYTVSVGCEYSHEDRWALSTGYRFLNAGDFQGPQYQRVANGSAVDVANDQWQMRLRANEWFIEFKIFI